MGQEDFTTYTESDPNNRLSHTAARSTFAGLLRTDVNTFLYKNKSGQLQNFTYYFKFRVTAVDSSDKTIRVMAFVVIEALDDWTDNRVNLKKQFGFQVRSNLSTTQWYWFVAETSGGLQYLSAQGVTLNVGTDYYVKVVKAGTTLTVSIYSDQYFTTLIQSKSLTLHGNWDLDYLAVPQSVNLATAIGISGYVENLTDTAPTPPTGTGALAIFDSLRLLDVV